MRLRENPGVETAKRRDEAGRIPGVGRGIPGVESCKSLFFGVEVGEGGRRIRGSGGSPVSV